jgi:hypothetical protein
MTTLAPDATHTSAKGGWISACETWMDRRGKGAWMAAMILGMIFFWPVGLALLFYMIWSKRMFSKSQSCSRSNSFYRRDTSSGNTAFDAYKPTRCAGLRKNNSNLKPSWTASAQLRINLNLTNS